MKKLHKSRLPTLTLMLSALLLSLSTVAAADPIAKVQSPQRYKNAKERTVAIKKARRQRVSPDTSRQLSSVLGKQAKSLGEQRLNDPAFREAMSKAPLKVRLEVFKEMAAARANPAKVQTFERRMRGMLKKGQKENVAKAKKTFFEVTSETFELFHTVMGQNVVWFTAAENPGHLHTLVKDQDGGPNFTHNTYGQGTLSAASPEKRVQYTAPALLTDSQMDRFTRYLNAGVEHGKESTYGFWNSKGDLVCPTKCTNWATSAPVGDLHRWAATTDKRVIAASKAGTLGPEFKDGLHKALAKAPDSAARAAIVAKVSKNKSVSKWTRSSARRLGKEFDKITKQFPNRPRDLVGRQTLAETMGINRSQDPAKFMYDLFMAKSVPVIGVLSSDSQANFKDMTFKMEIMGNIEKNGQVSKGSYSDYSGSGEKGGRGVIKPGRSSVVPEGTAEAGQTAQAAGQ